MQVKSNWCRMGTNILTAKRNNCKNTPLLEPASSFILRKDCSLNGNTNPYRNAQQVAFNPTKFAKQSY